MLQGIYIMLLATKTDIGAKWKFYFIIERKVRMYLAAEVISGLSEVGLMTWLMTYGADLL